MRRAGAAVHPAGRRYVARARARRRALEPPKSPSLTGSADPDALVLLAHARARSGPGGGRRSPRRAPRRRARRRSRCSPPASCVSVRSSRSVARRGVVAGARVAVPGAGEAGEAGAPAVAVRGQHRADAAAAVGVAADDDRVAPRSRRASPAWSRAACSRWRCAAGARVGVGVSCVPRSSGPIRCPSPAGPKPGYGGPSATSRSILLVKGDLHAVGAARWLLGSRAHRRAAARDRPGGRVGRASTPSGPPRPTAPTPPPCSPGSRREHRADQARLGDLPDARPHAGDDRDDRGHARQHLERADAARDRVVRPAGGRGLARPAVRQAAPAHARVRRDPAQGARPRARRLRRRDLHAADPRRARQGAEAHDRPGAGADPDLHRGDRAEEHAAHRRDRRRLAAHLLLPRARRRVPRACSRRARRGTATARRSTTRSTSRRT